MLRTTLILLIVVTLCSTGFGQESKDTSVVTKSLALHQESEDTSVITKGLTSYEEAPKSKAIISGYKNSFSVLLPEGDRRLVNRVWKTYARNHFNARMKYDRKSKEYTAKDAEITPVTSSPINMISKTEKIGGQIRLSMWLDGEETYSKSLDRPRNAYAMEGILEDFAIQLEKEKVRIHLKEEEKNLGKYEAKLRRLENAQKRYYHEIEIAKARIKRLEENIIQNELDQLKANDDILLQLEKVAVIKDDYIKY